MSQISNAISNNVLKSSLIPFITAGYPTFEATKDIIHLLDREGVNAIEVGIPYSDALADGPIIQESSRIALENKTGLDQVLSLVKHLTKKIKTPLIIFTYLNPVLSKGAFLFIKSIAEAGVKGIVIPDLPIEEADYFIAVCNYYKVELILFISPASTDERIDAIISKAPGCIYLVSSYGVTGLRSNFQVHISNVVKKIKSITNKRIMLGFGISNEHQVAEIMNLNCGVDAIVIGSAFTKKIKTAYANNSHDEIVAFCQNIKKVMK